MLDFLLKSNENSGGGMNQLVGTVPIIKDRCIAFANTYQYRISSFGLVDVTKPGHQKIVGLFLVDPEHRTPSTADIPPQQAHWSRRAIHDFLDGCEGSELHLPVELMDMIMGQVEGLMTLEEAKIHRQQLTNRRGEFARAVNDYHFNTQLSVADLGSECNFPADGSLFD